MSDYIKREDAMKTLADEYDECEFKRYAEGLFKDIPSADVVPVVRCKDCKCWTEWANGTGSCNRFTLDWIDSETASDGVEEIKRVYIEHSLKEDQEAEK